FRYKPLDTTKQSIRLAEITPDDSNDLIICHLSDCDLARKPSYTALSYTWDRGNEQRDLLCDGKVMPIGSNLCNFLHRFRDRQETCAERLWIDAICINQDDVGERNHQVAQIRSIYTVANRVI
ncbi:hypothetical protein EK21DRAFT_11979, partial [Setomelanomma holmii]